MRCALIIAIVTIASVAHAYPYDEGERTGIRRLKWQANVEAGKARGRKMVKGGTWPGRQILLKMKGAGSKYDLTPETPKDPQLQAALEAMLKKWRWSRYNVAILDITDPKKPRFAAVNEHVSQTPGSVAKVLTAAAMFAELKKRYPDDIAKREEMLRTHEVTADDWARSDSHEVPFILDDAYTVASYRKIRAGSGHTFTLWEWMDHALSPSNNSAASTVWREATLMKLLGDEYPPTKYDKELWAKWDRDQMAEASFAAVNEPLVAAGIDPEAFKLRLYFTSGANRYIRSKSCGLTPFALVRWMLRVEQGKMVDEWSSLELKKMLYLTRRRVRYLYTHSLDDFGAYFKSGSLYRFSEHAERIQYQGDTVNVLNSLIEIDTSEPLPTEKELEERAKAEAEAKAAEVKAAEAKAAEAKAAEAKVDGAKADETKTAPKIPATDAVTEPAPKTGETEDDEAAAEAAKPKPYIYIVAVMSNELKRNAAIDHSKLAEAIHAAIIEPPAEETKKAEKAEKTEAKKE